MSITNSQSSLRPMCIESVMPSNHLILCRPLLLLPPIFPSIRVFSNESALRIRWPKYWSFSFSISPSSEYSGLISFRMGWFRICGPCPLPAWFIEGFYCGMLRVHTWSRHWSSARNTLMGYFAKQRLFILMKSSSLLFLICMVFLVSS